MLIIILLVFIVCIVLFADNVSPASLIAYGEVIGKGFDPERQINDAWIYDKQWWIRIYDYETQTVSQIYLPRSVWAKTHVGQPWTHGTENYDE